MILYRPVGLQELALIYDSGMEAFPTDLPRQPIFYPVFDLEYARQTASAWNAQNGQFAGYVTQFKVEGQYINQFEEHAVGGSQYQELWIPAEKMEEFNQHIIGHIKIVEAYFGDGFQGFIPEKFGLQGKNAAEQFALLADSYLYKRMDFYLEIKRNHKAVFLNYPFWQTYEFKNPGLKEKMLQAIKEAWFTSFPKIPLPLPPPIHDETPLVEQRDSYAQHLVDPVEEDIRLVKEADSHPFDHPVDEDLTPVKETDADALVDPARKDIAAVEPRDSHSPVDPVREDIEFQKQTHSHFVHGIKLGLKGEYHEAMRELFKATEEDPDHVEAHTSLGVAFHRLSEDDRALACYETALQIDPIYAEAHYFRANILYRHGSIREAITGYTVAIGLKPDLIEAHQKPSPEDRLTDYVSLPAEMYRIAKPAYRILELNELLESTPGQAHLFKERAAEYYRLRNYAQAIADYSSALEIQPDDAIALHFRGLAYEQLGESDRAQDDFQKTMAINSQLSNVYINRGVTFGHMGNFRQAVASFTEGIRLAPQDPDSYFNRGMAYFQQGDLKSAIQDFSQVIRLSPGDEDAYYWRGISYEGAGHPRDAIADYRQFLAISQNSRAREEIEQKLSQWNEGNQNSMSPRRDILDEGQQTDRVQGKSPDRHLDLYDLIVALGRRALHSTWFGSGVECYGEKAEELHLLIDEDRPIEGRDLLQITSGIRQTIQGDFHAFDPGAASHWIFIRVWEGSGFYIEVSDLKSKQRLKARFQSAEEVEGASPPYESLFIRI